MYMQCESVKGHRIPDACGTDDAIGLWDKKPGTWRWRLRGHKGERELEAVLPSRYPEGPGIVHPYQICNCLVSVEAESHKGTNPCWGWDGNIEAPTLQGSILVETLWGEKNTRVFWHGYMESGHFRACE